MLSISQQLVQINNGMMEHMSIFIEMGDDINIILDCVDPVHADSEISPKVFKGTGS